MTGVILLVNPASGGGRSRAWAHAAAAQLQRRGLQPEIRWAAAPGEIELMARALADGGSERLLVCGGDGTMHEAVNALAGTGTTLGILPCGRGNDLAAAVGIPVDPGRAADLILDGGVRSIDVGRVGERWFATVLAIGLDADVAIRTRRGLWSRAGRLGYVACAITRLVSYAAPRLTISGDFGRRDGSYILAAAGNTVTYGGGVPIAPGASVDDGLLDLCLVRDLPRWQALALVRRILQGRHGGAAEVEMLRSSWLELKSEPPIPLVADGEPVGTTPVRVGLEPGALRVLVPA